MTSNRISPGCAAHATIKRMVSGRFGNGMHMDRTAYDRRSFRNLPRDTCIVADIFGLDDCRGLIHRHHVDPEDPDSRTLPVCNRHHQHLHKTLRTLSDASERPWRRCTHHHPYPGGKEACERRLNS